MGENLTVINTQMGLNKLIFGLTDWHSERICLKNILEFVFYKCITAEHSRLARDNWRKI